MNEENSLRDPNNNWLQRWAEQDIGWHHEEFNSHLLNYWTSLDVPEGSVVLTPLCGKSRDMAWLAERGYRVHGIELSPLAVAEFFEEQQLTPERVVQGAFECWSAGPYELFCGDIFDLDQIDLSEVGAVYDRASLVALNPEQRKHYAQMLGQLLPNICPILLVAMDYPQREMEGPPYSVNEVEVRALFAQNYTVKLLHSLDLMKETDRYREKGLSRMLEEIYKLSSS